MNDANQLRSTLVQEMFVPFNAKLTNFEVQSTDENLRVAYGSSFKAKTMALPNVDFITEQSTFIGAHLRQFEDGRWHLNIARNRMQRVDEGLSEQRIRTLFRIVCWGDELVEAKRTVKFVKVTPWILAMGKEISDSNLAAKPYYKRVGSTSPIQPEDCSDLIQQITRHASRAKIERGI